MKVRPKVEMTWLMLAHTLMGVEGFARMWEWAGMQYSVVVEDIGVVGDGVLSSRP